MKNLTTILNETKDDFERSVLESLLEQIKVKDLCGTLQAQHVVDCSVIGGRIGFNNAFPSEFSVKENAFLISLLS
jgi:hypothetical protein